jgi:hypothetical protein
MVFSDLSSGILYGTTGDIDEVAMTVYALTMVYDGVDYSNLIKLGSATSWNDLFRAYPRFFQLPDGSAGVLREATGEYFRLTEMY